MLLEYAHVVPQSLLCIGQLWKGGLISCYGAWYRNVDSCVPVPMAMVGGDGVFDATTHAPGKSWLRMLGAFLDGG